MDGIMVELILWSDNADVSMNDLSQAIGIFPVECESIGETKYYGSSKKYERVVDTSSLLYSTGYIDTAEVEVATNKMVDVIEPKLSEMIDVINKYKLNAKFCIVVALSEKPIIALPSNFIQIMAKMHADLEFDTYFDCFWKGKTFKPWRRFTAKRKRKQM